MQLGLRIKALRQERHWSQGQLLVQARRHVPEGRIFSREILSKIENGYTPRDAWIVEALAEALDTSMDFLLGRTDDRQDEALEDSRVAYVVRSGVDPDTAQQLLTRFSRLSPADRQLVLDLVTRLSGNIRPRIVGDPPEE